jgi:hypothetical protein
MSFGFLSLTGYLGLCIIVSIILTYISVKRWNKDRKGLIVLYITITAGAIFAAVIRLLKEIGIYYKYFNNIGFVLMGYFGIIVIELFYLSLTHKGNAKSKRTILIGWGFIVIPLLMALLVYFMLD